MAIHGNTEAHAEQLSRVYSPVTWDLYEQLDRSLDPRGPDWLLDRAAGYLTPGARVLDAGCRDAGHLVRLVAGRDVTAYGIDPVELHIQRARLAVEAAGLQDRISLAQQGMEELTGLDRTFDLIWCRDVIPQVVDLPAALAGVVPTLKDAGRMVVFTQTSTELLTADETEMLSRHLGNVIDNLDENTLEAAFVAAGLAIEERLSSVLSGASTPRSAANPFPLRCFG